MNTDKPAIGSRVSIFDMGQHLGVVTAHAPTVTSPRSRSEPPRPRIMRDWITVKLDRGDEWHGSPVLVEATPTT